MSNYDKYIKYKHKYKTLQQYGGYPLNNSKLHRQYGGVYFINLGISDTISQIDLYASNLDELLKNMPVSPNGIQGRFPITNDSLLDALKYIAKVHDIKANLKNLNISDIKGFLICIAVMLNITDTNKSHLILLPENKSIFLYDNISLVGKNNQSQIEYLLKTTELKNYYDFFKKHIAIIYILLSKPKNIYNADEDAQIETLNTLSKHSLFNVEQTMEDNILFIENDNIKYLREKISQGVDTHTNSLLLKDLLEKKIINTLHRKIKREIRERGDVLQTIVSKEDFDKVFSTLYEKKINDSQVINIHDIVIHIDIISGEDKPCWTIVYDEKYKTIFGFDKITFKQFDLILHNLISPITPRQTLIRENMFDTMFNIIYKKFKQNISNHNRDSLANFTSRTGITPAVDRSNGVEILAYFDTDDRGNIEDYKYKITYKNISRIYSSLTLTFDRFDNLLSDILSEI